MATFVEALQNAVTFAGDMKTASQGLIKIETFGKLLTVEAYDDFTWISTSVENPFKGARLMFISKANVVADLKQSDPAFYLDGRASEADPGCFGDASEMITQPTSPKGRFWLSIDRWKKLGSLKPTGLPIEIRTHDDAGFPYASFKYGQTTGLLSFLDEDVLEEEGLL